MIARRSLWRLVLGAVAAPTVGRAFLAEGYSPAAVNEAARRSMALMAMLRDYECTFDLPDLRGRMVQWRDLDDPEIWYHRASGT